MTFANTATGTIDSVTQTFGLPNNSPNGALRTFLINVPATVTYPAGSAFTVTVAQGGNGSTTRVHPFGNGSPSRVELNSSTVINVDSVASYNAAYPGGAATASFFSGSTVYVRAVVSDPFGSFDIAGAQLDLIDANGTTQVANAVMTQVADSGVDTRTYEYAYTLPGPPRPAAGRCA